MIRPVLLISIVLASCGFALAQEPDLKAEEARQKQVMERFLGVLEKTPRRGTALDRVYGYHVEWGSLDKFVEELRERTKKDPKDGSAWMILGLIVAQRGEDAAAVEAFKQAETQLPQNALASYYLGQALVLVGQPDQAVEAFERAIARKPAQADLLEIFQQLGRVHQRAQRTENALEAWNRLEKLFPNDPRVQEQIAVTLVEEGQPALALPRYETLAKITKDDYRKTVYRMEVAELKVKLGKKDEGLTDLESLMSGLNPDSWLHREVRRRIEDVFLRTGDEDGLAKYYERWIAKNKEDVDSMARLARVLARSARVPEATKWLDKALKLAPKRKELRLAFIEQLVDDQRFGEAAAQYAALDQTDPNNPDYIREWGKLVLKDKSQPIEIRRKQAEQVWRKLVTAKPKDALIATQVADLFRQAEMKTQALELYKKAVELGGDDPQYREYLGEYYHLLKQPEDALKTWKEIATGKRRTAENVARLAEVYNGFGYVKEAVAEIAAACKLDPKDFSLQLKSADYHTRAEKYEDALKFVAAAEKLAANDDEREEVLLQRVKVFQAQLSLDTEIEKLAEAVKDKNATAATWFLLARYQEAARQYPEASASITEALKREPASIPALATAARIEEQGGNLLAAADLNRKLANTDRRSRTDYLTTVSRLESQLGRKTEALQAGRDVIAAAPGNTEHYEFFAQLCFRLGNADEGLETLRRAVRINPTEPKLAMTLGAALAEQFRADEAIQVYWAAFDKVAELEDKLQIVQKQTELYTQLNQFDKLVERLERDRREDEKRRELTICLSQAYHSSGDYGTARQELESLLNENTRDTQLLQQLSKLSEEENDLASAIRYQEQLAKLAPGPESEFRLAQLLQRAGSNEEASALLVKLTQREQDPERVLRSIDQLLTAGNFETALAITEPLLRDQPRNWELLYREGAALASLGKTAEATERFKRLLEFSTPLDELGVAAANRRKKELAKQKSKNAAGRRPQQMVPEETIYTHMDEIYRILPAVGLQFEEYYSGQPNQPVWTPQMYVAARTAANGWQLAFAQKAGKADEFIAGLRKAADAPKASERAIVDWLALSSLRQNGRDKFAASKKLAQGGSLAAKQHYLANVANRTYDPEQQNVYSSDNDPEKDTTPPLPADDLALVLECYKAVARPGASGTANMSLSYVQTVVKELRRAKRDEEAEKLMADAIASASEASQISAAMALVAEKGDMPKVQAMFDRWSKAWLSLPAQQRANSPYYYDSPVQHITRLMGLKGPDKAHADILTLFEQYTAFAIADANIRRAQPKKSRSQAGGYYGYGINYWYGKQQLYTQIDYPSANEYVDYNLLLVLRNVFEIFHHNDVDSDFVAHLKKQAEKAAPNEALYRKLMLGYALWWSDEHEAAVAELQAAAKLVPQDLNMQLEFAALNEAQGNFDDALAMVDAVNPVDQAALQRRETMALQLAERLGDVERARTAAERLFGLRLDSDTQLQLAQRMRRLGMDKLAEAVTSRAQRQAGNRTSALLTLMTHYQGLGRTDLAIQLAHTILRRSPGASSIRNSSRYRGQIPEDNYRQQALQLLAQTGTLQEMIARVEGQMKTAADPSGQYQTLAEYYTAMGDRDKAMDLQGKIVALRPDDMQLRNTYAQQLEQAGKMPEACDQYALVLKKRPDLLANNFYQVRNTFERANKSGDLAAALEQMDLKAFRSPWYLVDLAGDILRNKESRTAGLKLFKRVYDAYPSYRQYLVNRLYDDDLLAMPEVYEMSKNGLLPSSALSNVPEWHGLDQIYSYSGDGKVYSMVAKVLDAAAKQNKFDDLHKEIEAGLAKHPAWTAGKVLLALVEFRQGKKDQAKAAMMAIVKDEKALKGMGMQTRWIVGQELENFGDMQPVVIGLYEGAFESADRRGPNEFEYSPGMRLVNLYIAAGRREDARKLLQKAQQMKRDDRYDREYSIYRQIQSGLTIAEQYRKLDFPLDAIKIYRDALADPHALATADRYYGGRPNYLSTQVRTKLAELLQSLSSEKAASVVLELLKPPAKPVAAGAEAPPAVDLMLTTPLRELDKSQMQSAFATLLREVSKNTGTEKPLVAAVTDLSKEKPDDLSAQITALLVLKQSGKSEELAARLPDLVALVKKTPLEEVPEGKRPNSRQRAEALKQVPLWLVARELLADEKHKDTAVALADRAVEAAGRQLDNLYTVSILHEWGQLALTAGDRKTAEDRWTKLLELVTARPKPKKEKPARPTSRIERELERRDSAKHPEGMPEISRGMRPQADTPGSVARMTSTPEGSQHRSSREKDSSDLNQSIAKTMPSTESTTSTAALGCCDPSGVEDSFWAIPGVSAVGLNPRLMAGIPPGCLDRCAPRAVVPSTLSFSRSALCLLLAQVRESKAAAPAAKPAAPAKAKPEADGADRVPPITVSQFTQAIQLAKLAAQNDMPQLSLRAVREALAGGAPLPDINPNDESGSLRLGGGRRPRVTVTGASLGGGSNDQTMGTVASSLRDLSTVWQAKNFPPADVYALLKPIVFPDDRPNEILVYSEGVTTSSSSQSSLGATLVTWAVRAGRGDFLKKAIEDRQKTSPLATLPGDVLLVQLALQSHQNDAARNGLTAIAEHLKTDQGQASVELACHAALPAFEIDELCEAAFPIMEHAVRQFSAQGRDDVGELTRRLTRYLGQKGDAAGAKKQLEIFLANQQIRYSRYGGDYALYLQRQDMATAALEAARSRLPDLALEYLGRYSDAPPYRYSDVSVERPLYLVARELLKKPAAERYALLKTWSLPAEKRKTVRLVAAWTEPNHVPEIFLKTASPKQGSATGGAATGGATGASLSGEYLSNFDLLFEAAREAGKLDELTAEVKKAVADKALRASSLLAVLLVRQGGRDEAKPVLEGLLADFDKRTATDNRTERGISIWAEYLVCRACLESPAGAAWGRQYAEKVKHLTQSQQSWAFMTFLRNDLARAGIAELKGATFKPGDDPGLKYWRPFTPFGETLHGNRPWWVVQEGQVSHVGGTGHDMLYFQWPVAGEFEFSLDGYNGGWGEGDAGYAGVVVEAQHRGAQTQVWPVGQHESINRGEPMEREEAGFNRITVQSQGGKLRYLLNGYLVYEESAGKGSPWLQLYAHFPRLTSFKNLRITGKPVIPREVPLVDGNRLEGWMTAYQDRQPRRRLMAEKKPENEDEWQAQQRQEPQTYDWQGKDGEIVGTAIPTASPKDQSWLLYHRPLQNGDRLRYEFQYEPGKLHVHPAIGRLAFVLQPDGVQLHWLATQGWETDVLNLSLTNAVVDPSTQRGPEKLPLKAGEWNAIEIALRDGTVSIALNGTEIAQRKLEDDNDRRFGLFRYRGETSARVRNVVLKGDWPEALSPEVLADLLAVNSEPAPADRRARHVVLGEQFILGDTLEVWRRAMRLPPEDRYAYLKAWVLPGDSHSTYRLMVASLPVDLDLASFLGRKSAEGSGNAAVPGSAETVDTGDLAAGAVVSPAMLLVDTAAALKKVDDLQKAVDAAPSRTNEEKRGQLALQVLLAIAGGDLPLADQRMRELFVFDRPLLPPSTPLHERMPEYVAVWRAADSPALAPVAYDLAQLLVDKHQAQHTGVEWERHIRELRGRAKWKLDSTTAERPYGTFAPGLAQWVVSPFLTARQRGEGFRPSGWRIERGLAEHVPASSTSRLIFCTPLRGDYEVSGERTTFGWRETYVSAGGIGVDVLHDQKGYWLRRFHREYTKPDVPVSIPGWNHFVRFRMTVKGGVLTASFNGVPVHTETLPPNRDPWLLVESSQVGCLGAVRDLKVTGTPEIPEVLNLSEIDHLAGWRSDAYGDSIGFDDNAHWRQQGEEIVGKVRTDRIGQNRESLLAYHRPVVEDAEIQYEFLYLPGQQEVHPCVGLSALVIRPDGVRLHRLTAAQYELGGLAPDNLSEIPDAAKTVALKEKEWNAVKLTFRGADVTLSVNGADVARMQSPLDGQRLFGLFRYSDRTGCRVRKITYRGDWPKTLLKPEGQELAYAPGGFSPPVSGLVETAGKFSQGLEKLAAAGVKPQGDAKQIKETPKGLVLSVPAGQPRKPGNAGVFRNEILKGDFDVSISFSDLKLVAPKDGYGTGLDFNLSLADPNNSRIALERRILKDGRQILHAVWAHRAPDGQDTYQVWSRDTDATAATLRMVRHGGRIYFLYALNGSKELEVLQTMDVGTADVRSIAVTAQSSDAAGGVDATLTEFSIGSSP